MNAKAENAVRIAENIIIAVLFAATLILCGACFILMSRTDSGEADGGLFRIDEIGGISDTEPEVYKSTVLQPLYVCLTRDGVSRIAYDGTATEAYELAVRDAASVLSSGTLEKDEWTDGDNDVTLRYRNSVPLISVLDYAGEGHGLNGIPSSLFITEMRISYRVSSVKVSIRTGGGVYSVTAYLPTTEYEDIVSVMASAVISDEIDGVLIAEGVVTVNRYEAMTGISAESLTRTERETLIGVFGMNPDKVRTNVHPSGGITFVDVSGTVVVDGSVKYTAYEGGVKLDISSYGGESAVASYLLAADSYISTVADAIDCGELPPLCLDYISVTDGVLTFGYTYTTDNIMLTENGEALGATVSFSEDRLISLELDVASAKKTDGVCTLLSGSLAYGGYNTNGIYALVPVHSVSDGITVTDWCVILGGDGE